MRLIRVVAVTGLALLTLTGCPAPENPGNKTPAEARLRKFDSPDALLRYFREQAREQSTPRQGGLFPFFGRDVLAGAPTSAEDSAGNGGQGDAAAGGGDSFTGTNLQEADVDESDFFKFDGQNLYIARNQTIRIVRAVPLDEMAEIARISFDEPISELFLDNDRLIVFSGGFGGYYSGRGEPGIMADIAIWPPYYENAALRITAVDVSDPAAPSKAESVELDGSLVSSRIANGRLILVLAIQPSVPQPATTAALQTVGLDDILPSMSVEGQSRPMVEWSDWYRPEDPGGYQMTAVVTLDVSDVSNVMGSAAVMSGAGTIYSSSSALYLTDTNYNFDGQARETTSIHKFSYDNSGVAQYIASGSVPGRLLNQFSLGEFEGRLRIATHVQDFGGFDGPDIAVSAPGGGNAADARDGAVSTAQTRTPAAPSNSVYVLAENGDDLDIVGSIEEIAPGERLYSARFMGPRGFLVTFEQIDPLFTLDLSDHARPRIRGELKIPGYSDYLHVYQDDLLIGVGRSTETTPWGGVVPSNMQLSLFDVSDLDDPKVIQQLTIGGHGSYAEASYSHKAFALLNEDGLLALPAVVFPESVKFDFNFFDVRPFSGTLVYQVTESGFEPVGALGEIEAAYYGYSAWRRAAISGRTLYTLNDGGVRAASLDDLDAVTELALGD